MRQAAVPDRSIETGLLAVRGRCLVAGVDEVGRGALGGPVTVGVAVLGAAAAPVPEGLADSKLLSARRREALVPSLRSWVRDAAVGHATAAEIDAWGITAALRVAGHRAFARLSDRVDVVLLDGRHDWLSPPLRAGLFDGPVDELVALPEVVTVVGADRRCAVVAAASVLAKVERDGILAGMASRYPGYGWERNKGYGSAEHIDALAALGPCAEHRRSWRLPGVRPDGR